MASIFRRDDNYTEQPNRNTVDMSFQNNMTTDFGSLRPCICVPVMPGDSWRIRPTFGLKFLPMTWPVQTRMKASIHYFYVRNRNLWKDWMDFIGKTKEGLVPPYIHLTEQNRKQVETSQLGDFLGIPSEMYDTAYEYAPYVSQTGVRLTHDSEYGWQILPEGAGGIFTAFKASQFDSVSVGDEFDDLFDDIDISSSHNHSYNVLLNTDNLRNEPISFEATFGEILTANSSVKLLLFDTSGVCRYVSPTGAMRTDSTVPLKIDFGTVQLEESWFTASDNRRPSILCTIVFKKNPSFLEVKPVVNVGVKTVVAKSVSDMPLSALPWRSDENSDGIPLSALPFRAYESIYNTYYRNAENNPLLINGVPEYNKWIRTNEGGADTNFYPIMYHNWEDDFLTTAVPSPQQGNAPLVGLSGTPTLTIGHDDGTTTEMSLEVDENGAVTAANAVSGDQATQAALIEAVSYGISINDFRNVNSFQRWLENNIRRGYKYKDQIKTHYGVSVRYDELDMPEFIGGTSEPVLVNQISQTVATDSDPLGSIAGQASSVGQGKEITHYCDEHGFIIGILCVKPVANYSQLLPKYFNITDTFDYYFPEFGHIGMQPITYAEVTPLQAFQEGKLNDVFGYQRAWYDLIAKTDEVHGLFRSDFRNFLINRTFDGTPELGKEFTVMDPNQINDVFAYTENTDKILGQIYMEISKKTPIPLYGIPKLE